MAQAPRTAVRFRTLPVVGALPGQASRLAQLEPIRPLAVLRPPPDASPTMRERMERGRLGSPLPYGVIDDYNRELGPLELPAFELDNGIVRVQVLPSLGGRVWSMLDLRTGRELLHRNPALRWANFGLTDAWFAGGIEWNLGSTGHATTSNLPMHAARLDTPLGEVLRLWEWERTRDLVLQVDLWLRDDRLMASTRVHNPDPEDKPLYYWTNIAIPETDDTRVLVPADHAWRTSYSGSLERVEVPFPGGGVDVSRPGTSRFATDWFYDVEQTKDRFIAAVDTTGEGFAQTSTNALRGRKQFLWGRGPGGQRWQEWLSGPDHRYLEIQAGVCPTQLEHDLLPGHASITWTEAFGAIALDPAATSGDYVSAADAARAAVEAALPNAELAALHDQWVREAADATPGPLLHTGSGWGAVELALRGSGGPAATPFPTVDDDSAPLHSLVVDSDPTAIVDLPAEQPILPPLSARWTTALARAATETDAWWLSYAIATAQHVQGELAEASRGYARSIELRPTAWALRGLALLTEDADERAVLYRRAIELAPDERRLQVERLVDLARADRHAEVVDVVDALPTELHDLGRIRMILARALAQLGEDDHALALLDDLEVADLAEGDTTPSDIWEQLRPGEPVPEHLDFRMAAATPTGADGVR